MWLVMKSYHLGAFLQFFFFPENVIMTRLEFLKLVLHCIEELTEQQTPFFFFFLLKALLVSLCTCQIMSILFSSIKHLLSLKAASWDARSP